MIQICKFKRSIQYAVHLPRFVSTWSPLAMLFNSPPVKRMNITKNLCGLFNVSELTSFEGFHLLKENAINKTDDLLNEVVSPTRTRKMVEIFDELSDSLCKVADLAEFVRLAHPDPHFARAAEDACISISGIVEKLNTNKQLYQALKHITEKGDIVLTSEVDNHVSKLFLFDFEQSGIHLEEEQRQKVVRLNDNILQLGQKFMAGAVHPRSVNKSLLPPGISQYFPSDGDRIIVSGLYTDSNNATARETAYKVFLDPNEYQEQLLKDLLRCRKELALTCGFKTYAHRALKGSTVECPETVNEFINVLSKDLRPLAEKDFLAMENIKKTHSQLNDVQLAPWDTPYFTAIVKRQWLQTNASEFTPYFSLGGCMEGLNNLMQTLYGITLENTEINPGETWHNDIYKLSVVHEKEGLLGYIYCDLFERNGKPNQDCHFTIQGGKHLGNESYQLPIVVIMLNLNQPRWSGPTLLSPSMVDNLFHEMGHAMHSMLARTEYQHVTGTRCSTDFAEVPSILMEYFASDSRVLRTFAKHFQTQEPMPEAMLQRLCASKNIFSASETQLQVFYSALDQEYHGNVDLNERTTTDILKNVQEKYYSLPYVPNTAWQLRFSHLVGYGAKYYSYLISKAIASWIWQTYFEDSPLNRTAGEKYRRECLAFGGGIPSKKLVSNFLQRDVTPKNLSQNLINEIEYHNDKISSMSKKLVLDCK